MKSIKIKPYISQIYLFFEYDGHAQKFNKKYSDENISEMLEYFTNETEGGKLYISYPMAEAIKDFKKADRCNRRCWVSAKENIKYKRLVGNDSDFVSLNKVDKNYWTAVSCHTIRKSSCILNSRYELPDYNEYINLHNQMNIFERQLNYIKDRGIVFVLSGFPFFLLDYFGHKFLCELFENKYLIIEEVKKANCSLNVLDRE